MRKAYGHAAGLTGLIVCCAVLAVVFAIGALGAVTLFPVMAVLGPAIVIQYAWWVRAARRGADNPPVPPDGADAAMIVHLAHGRARARDLLDGIVYRLGRLGTAAAVIAEAIGVDERDASAHITLGDTFDALGHLDQAASSYARATRLRSGLDHRAFEVQHRAAGCGQAWRSQCLLRLGTRAPASAGRGLLPAREWVPGARRPDAAMARYREALSLDSGYAHQHYARGVSLQVRGRRSDAMRMGEMGLTLKPDDPELAYSLQAIEGASSPARAPDDFITEHFDRFAETFDSVPEGKLRYCIPRHLFDAMRRTAGKSDALDVLDIGCGTGLCGPLLRPLARLLVGIDLSPKMVDKARERGVYDGLPDR